jgi:type II restriction enzyme
MNLIFDFEKVDGYKNNSQKIRILTENWVHSNMFCPRCGNSCLSKFPNNTPVADFFCPNCKNIYELKSKKGKISSKIVDGAYNTMIKRIESKTNPDFMFLSYDGSGNVCDLVIMPKHFFVPNIIEKRKALSETAKRAGWVGCNILISKIPQSGRIYVVKDKSNFSKKEVVNNINKTRFLEKSDLKQRGWIMDIMKCIDKIHNNEFTLNEVYKFEQILKEKHPNNRNIKPKIRQQLQFLRDKHYIKFLGQGKYSKIN